MGTSSIPPDVEQFTISQSETLILFTDGSFDVVDESGQMLGVEGFCEHATKQVSSMSSDVASAADRVNAALDQVQGDRPPADDRTMLLVRQTGVAASAATGGR